MEERLAGDLLCSTSMQHFAEGHAERLLGLWHAQNCPSLRWLRLSGAYRSFSVCSCHHLNDGIVYNWKLTRFKTPGNKTKQKTNPFPSLSLSLSSGVQQVSIRQLVPNWNSNTRALAYRSNLLMENKNQREAPIPHLLDLTIRNFSAYIRLLV